MKAVKTPAIPRDRPNSWSGTNLAMAEGVTLARRAPPFPRSVMRKSWCVLALAGVLLAPARGFAAADPEAVASGAPAAGRLRLPDPGQLAALMATDDAPPPVVVRVVPDRDPRRAVLSSLHAVTGVVQTYDGMLTMRVLKAGGVESNPLMKPVVRNEGAMMGVKIAAAVATVIGTETLWHDNHRLAAIVTSIVANSGMAMIARHNARVLAQLEGR